MGETGEAGEVGWGHGARAQNVIPRSPTILRLGKMFFFIKAGNE